MTAPRRPGLLALSLCALVACGGDSPVRPTPPSRPTPAPAPSAVPSDLRPVIEALFLGSGPLTPRDGQPACVFFPGFWTAYPRRTTVRVKVSTTVAPDARDAIQTAAAQVATATAGVVQATFEMVNEALPLPGPAEVTVTTHPDPVSQGCPTPVGCTIPTFAGGVGMLSGARSVLPPSQTPNAFAHDAIGHGVLGMCHVDGTLAGGPENSLMSGGPGVFSSQIARTLTDRDLRAAQAVYSSALSPGAQRAEFVTAGLVNP